MKNLVCLFLLALSGLLIAQDAQSLLWKIESESGNVSYLFGTYHLLGSNYLNDHSGVASKFEEAETVVVETVIDSSQLIQVGVKTMDMQNSLRAEVDSLDYILLKETLEPIMGMDLQMLDKIKPMALTAAIAVDLAQKNTPAGFNYQGTPIDLFFAEKAKQRKLNLVPLETMLEQVELLYGQSSFSEQADDLVEMVSNLDSAATMMSQLVEAYQEEDLKAMLALGQLNEEAYGDMDVFLDQRNMNWIPKLIPHLEKGQTFIAVGALHLPGKKGVIALLREKGYQLTPLPTK